MRKCVVADSMDDQSPCEFDMISTYFGDLGCWPDLGLPSQFAIEIGDDCAVVDVPSGYQLCFSIDTLVSGVHFPQHISPERLASRALAATISDCYPLVFYDGNQPS